MNRQEYDALRAQLAALRGSGADEYKAGAVPPSIAYLENELQSAAQTDHRVVLYALLSTESERFGQRDRRLLVLRRQAEEFPDDPMSQCALSSALAEEHPPPSEALAIARRAIALAKRANRMVRYALTSGIRAAIKSEDYAFVSSALRDLIDDANQRREEDQSLETDFLAQIEDKVDPEVLSRYAAMIRERGSRSPR